LFLPDGPPPPTYISVHAQVLAIELPLLPLVPLVPDVRLLELRLLLLRLEPLVLERLPLLLV